MKKNILLGVIAGLVSLGILVAVFVFIAPVGGGYSSSGRNTNAGNSKTSVSKVSKKSTGTASGASSTKTGQKANPTGGTMKADAKKSAAVSSKSKSATKSSSEVKAKASSESSSKSTAKSSSGSESSEAGTSKTAKKEKTADSTQTKTGSSSKSTQKSSQESSEKKASSDRSYTAVTEKKADQDTETILLSYAQKQEYTYGEDYAVAWSGEDYDRSAIPTTNFGYCIKDFDGDGQDELLILAIESDYSVSATVYEEKSGKTAESDSLHIEYPQSGNDDVQCPEIAGLYDGTLEAFVFDHDGIKIALDAYTYTEEDGGLRRMSLLSYSENKLNLEKVIYLGERYEGWGTDAEPYTPGDSTGSNVGRQPFREALEGYGAENIPAGSDFISTGTRFITFFPSASAFAKQDFEESVSVSELKGEGDSMRGQEVGTVSLASKEDLDSGKDEATAADDGTYCHDLDAQYSGFTLAGSAQKPEDKGDYYELPVTVYTDGDYEIAEKELGKTTVRISKDAKVLYMGYDENGNASTNLISLDEYAEKTCGASSYSDCTYTRIWSNIDDPGSTSDQAYKVYYDGNGYITQFYDGEFN